MDGVALGMSLSNRKIAATQKSVKAPTPRGLNRQDYALGFFHKQNQPCRWRPRRTDAPAPPAAIP
jgi:hypothetical protein